MKLISLNKYIGLLLLLISSLPVLADEQIDIWNKEKKENSKKIKQEKNSIDNESNNSKISNTTKLNNDIQIEKTDLDNSSGQEIFGIYDPEENDFNLNMWSQTDAQNVRSSISRINKLNLSTTAEKLFEINTLRMEFD